MIDSALVKVSDLRRSFGKVEAVRGVSFDLQPGEVVGFIGANGAGKTTTMRIMATLDLPDTGEVRIAGADALNYPAEVRRSIGWMPESYGTWTNVTVAEYLDFYARAYGFRGADRADRVAEVMEFTDLGDLAERPMDGLSKGMGQRLCLGRTLLHDPPVLILDEPAAGLDPRARIDFKRLVRLLAEDGKCIFISSHILSELGEMCDSILFVDNGRIIHHGSPESLRQRTTAAVTVRIEVAGDPADLRRWIEMNPGLDLVDEDRNGCRARLGHDADPATVAAVLARMVADGIHVVEFHREQARLEDAFVDMLRAVENGTGGGPLPPPLPGKGARR